MKSEIDPLRLKMNFIEYLNGYSKDVLDIIEKLHLRQVVDNLTEAERLGSIIEKFTSDKINLSSKPVFDGEGNLLHPALDNHTVGMMFEELLRRFNEENNVTEAGEHFTPRDYVKLLADLAVLPVADKIKATTYSVYDGACGTGGILTIAQERIKQIGKEQGKDVAINIYGQELLPDTYATCKADLMISGHIKSFQYNYAGEEREYIAFDSTVSRDGHAGETYDFCISILLSALRGKRKPTSSLRCARTLVRRTARLTKRTATKLSRCCSTSKKQRKARSSRIRNLATIA